MQWQLRKTMKWNSWGTAISSGDLWKQHPHSRVRSSRSHQKIQIGLEMGADDYVTKPLELRELVVRVKNLLWRIDLARQAQPHTQDNCYRFAGYCLNVSRHTLERDGEPIKLTRAEYEMLVAFVTNPGEILSRERLLRMLSARRVENPDLRTVDVLIRRLRHKLSADLLVTQHGEGYFLAADVC